VLYEVAGWFGATCVLLGYVIVTRFGTSLRYHVLNLLGAGGLLVNAVHHRAFPSSFVNVVWAMIAVWGLRLTAKRTAKAG
jgi:hypothetical protein